MVFWNLPERIRNDRIAAIYLEWEAGILNYQAGNIGEAVYHMEGTADTFRIQVRAEAGTVNLLVYYECLTINTIQKVEPVPQELSPDGCLTFILSGVHGNYSIHNTDTSNRITNRILDNLPLWLMKNEKYQLMAAGYNADNAYWEKETWNVSNIGPFHFPGDKKWETCIVGVRGTRSNQRFSIFIKAGERLLAKEEFSLKKDEIRLIERRVHKDCSIDVTGQLMVNGALIAGGSIYVTCTYDPREQLKSTMVSWNGITEEMSCIENLCLYDTQIWEKCEIYIEGYENRTTGCMITLISNGEIDSYGLIDWMELIDTQSGTLSFEVNRKVSLVVAGYLSSLSPLGAGAKLTLTGFYK